MTYRAERKKKNCQPKILHVVNIEVIERQKTLMAEDQKHFFKTKDTEKSIRDTKSMRQKNKEEFCGGKKSNIHLKYTGRTENETEVIF